MITVRKVYRDIKKGCFFANALLIVLFVLTVWKPSHLEAFTLSPPPLPRCISRFCLSDIESKNTNNSGCHFNRVSAKDDDYLNWCILATFCCSHSVTVTLQLLKFVGWLLLYPRTYRLTWRECRIVQLSMPDSTSPLKVLKVHHDPVKWKQTLRSWIFCLEGMQTQDKPLLPFNFRSQGYQLSKPHSGPTLEFLCF